MQYYSIIRPRAQEFEQFRPKTEGFTQGLWFEWSQPKGKWMDPILTW